MKPMPDKYVVVKRDYENPQDQGRIVYGPELKDRCEHWLKQVTRQAEPMMGPSPFRGYSIHQATIGWT